MALQEKNIKHMILVIDEPLPRWLRTKYEEMGVRSEVFKVKDDQLEDILGIMAGVCDLIRGSLEVGEGCWFIVS